MRIFIIGATGHTGKQLIDVALARGHSITAFVRSPQKLEALAHPRLSVVRGDPHDTDALAAALPGHDAVCSALGVHPPTAFRPHTLVGDCAASTVAAMTRAHVQRLALVSVAVLFPMPGLRFRFFRWMLQHIARDLSAAEAIVQASSLEWTIARPPRLTGGRGERYRARDGAMPDRGKPLPFRALAVFMIDAIEAHDHVRQVVGLEG
jgi:putative NADH-flavin reductase